MPNTGYDNEDSNDNAPDAEEQEEAEEIAEEASPDLNEGNDDEIGNEGTIIQN